MNGLYTFIETPSHGWLQVPKKEVVPVISKISGYSYLDADHIYLEEDSDAQTFIDYQVKNIGPVPIRRVLDDNEQIRQKQRIEQLYTTAGLLPYIKKLRQFMNPNQIEVIGSNIRGEEGDYFRRLIFQLAFTFENMPHTYQQDGLGEKAMIYLHYFIGGFDWYITEKDMGDPANNDMAQNQAFGIANIGMGLSGGGYISLVELIENNVELDFHWEPKTVGEVQS